MKPPLYTRHLNQLNQRLQVRLGVTSDHKTGKNKVAALDPFHSASLLFLYYPRWEHIIMGEYFTSIVVKQLKSDFLPIDLLPHRIKDMRLPVDGVYWSVFTLCL